MSYRHNAVRTGPVAGSQIASTAKLLSTCIGVSFSYGRQLASINCAVEPLAVHLPNSREKPNEYFTERLQIEVVYLARKLPCGLLADYTIVGCRQSTKYTDQMTVKICDHFVPL